MAFHTAEVVALLRGHPLIRSVRVVRQDETPQGRVELKVRCHLHVGSQLQVWLHSGPDSLDYAYQLFDRQPILRWDNSPHFPSIGTAPHHHHGPSGQLGPSPLTGDVAADLGIVLEEIARYLADSARSPL